MVLDEPIKQAEFADLVGITPSRVSELVDKKVLPRGGTGHAWLVAYCAHLRAIAAGRAGELDLSQERAALTRVHRELADLKLAETRGDLVRRRDIVLEFGTQLINLATALENLAARLAPMMVAETDLGRCQALLRDEHRAALTAFTDALDPPKAGAAGEGA
jgi:phage terminase Nu1 subunit (DNA packaging protein)